MNNFILVKLWFILIVSIFLYPLIKSTLVSLSLLPLFHLIEVIILLSNVILNGTFFDFLSPSSGPSVKSKIVLGQ
jgi:hypothetical protein